MKYLKKKDLYISSYLILNPIRMVHLITLLENMLDQKHLFQVKK
jgi:hypothetical protein